MDRKPKERGCRWKGTGKEEAAGGESSWQQAIDEKGGGTPSFAGNSEGGSRAVGDGELFAGGGAGRWN